MAFRRVRGQAASGQGARRAPCAGARSGRRTSCWARHGSCAGAWWLSRVRTWGRASGMSSTFALSRYGGGSRSSAPIDTRPALRSRLSLGAKRSGLVGPGERVQALVQAALGCCPVLVERAVVGGDIRVETARARSRSARAASAALLPASVLKTTETTTWIGLLLSASRPTPQPCRSWSSRPRGGSGAGSWWASGVSDGVGRCPDLPPGGRRGVARVRLRASTHKEVCRARRFSLSFDVRQRDGDACALFRARW